MNTDIREIEISIKQAEANIAARDNLNKLLSNRLFKKVILDGYFVKEASALVELKAAPQVQGSEDQTHISKQLDAIGYLRQYFTKLQLLGNMSENSLAQDRITQAELNEEVL
jgi:hypothetical protein